MNLKQFKGGLGHCFGCAWLNDSNGYCKVFRSRRQPIWRDKENERCLGYVREKRKKQIENAIQEYANLKSGEEASLKRKGA